MTEQPKKKRGFAAMSKERMREIASKGGKAAHALGTAHQFDSAEASLAGKKGGMVISRRREHMATIGRKGGEARRRVNEEARADDKAAKLG